MCTVSWFRDAQGFQLFFNRDERLTRAPARPPAVHREEGTRFLAPLDGDFGGSWLAVNELGLTLGLLNGYASDDPPPRDAADFTSRGRLLTSLLDCGRLGEIEARLSALHLDRFRSFLLAGFDRGGASLLATWKHERLALEREIDDRVPLVSSSFDTKQVRLHRVEEYRRMVGSATSTSQRHLEFHASHRPAAGPYSPCMHRPDGETVSFSWLQVDAEEARFYYVPHSPCRGLPREAPVRLKLHRYGVAQ